MKRCLKCGSDKKPTEHYLLPKCFYKGKGELIPLCWECYKQIEKIYKDEETKQGRNPKKRFRLKTEEYRVLFNKWLYGGNDDDDL